MFEIIATLVSIWGSFVLLFYFLDRLFRELNSGIRDVYEGHYKINELIKELHKRQSGLSSSVDEIGFRLQEMNRSLGELRESAEVTYARARELARSQGRRKKKTTVDIEATVRSIGVHAGTIIEIVRSYKKISSRTKMEFVSISNILTDVIEHRKDVTRFMVDEAFKELRKNFPTQVSLEEGRGGEDFVKIRLQ